MKNSKLFLVVVVLSLALAGCNSAAEVPVTPTATEMVVEEAPSLLDAPAQTGPSCVANDPPPQPSDEELAVYSIDPDRDWIKGPEDAPITIIEYADFQCPYCSQAADNLGALLEKYPDDVRIVYRHFPLASIHDKAILATQASEAAGLQGADYFWQMHDMLYETQSLWSSFSVEDFTVWLIEVGDQLGLDRSQFESDLFSEEIVSFSEGTWTDGQAIGLGGTPTLIINSLYQVNADLATLTAYVELIKIEDRKFRECPPLTVDSETSYLATVETEKGSFVIQLMPEEAPLAVNSFLFLAENGWFDGITFHRVLPGFVAQTGDPTGTGYGDPGYRFSIEVENDLIFDRAGLVAMANSGPESNGSQFFITYDAAPNLDGAYTIFGEVIEGMEVVQSITPRDPQQGVDLPPGDTLIRITIEQK